MSPWKHFPHHEPPEAVPLYIRTWPYPGALVVACYVGGTAWTFSTIPEGFVLPGAGRVPVAPGPGSRCRPTTSRSHCRRATGARCRSTSREDQPFAGCAGSPSSPRRTRPPTRRTAVGGYFDAVELPGFILPWWGVTLWRPAS